MLPAGEPSSSRRSTDTPPRAAGIGVARRGVARARAAPSPSACPAGVARVTTACRASIHSAVRWSARTRRHPGRTRDRRSRYSRRQPRSSKSTGSSPARDDLGGGGRRRRTACGTRRRRRATVRSRPAPSRDTRRSQPRPPARPRPRVSGSPASRLASGQLAIERVEPALLGRSARAARRRPASIGGQQPRSHRGGPGHDQLGARPRRAWRLDRATRSSSPGDGRREPHAHDAAIGEPRGQLLRGEGRDQAPADEHDRRGRPAVRRRPAGAR